MYHRHSTAVLTMSNDTNSTMYSSIVCSTPTGPSSTSGDRLKAYKLRSKQSEARYVRLCNVSVSFGHCCWRANA